jgi:hypothetical protein
MEMSQNDIPSSPEQRWQTADRQFQKQLENGLSELKAEVVERPFLWLAMAFIAGFVSQTFPVRILFLILMRLISWLTGPVILLFGVAKIGDLFSGSRQSEPTILQRP